MHADVISTRVRHTQIQCHLLIIEVSSQEEAEYDLNRRRKVSITARAHVEFI